MLHPNQFEVNETWIAFKLNDAPIRTERDGAFDCIGLMDAASCFVLGTEFVAVAKPGPSLSEARRLLKSAWKHNQAFPATLFVPSGQIQAGLPVEAERQGIAVVRVDESQLLVFIGEAQQSFRERFGGGEPRHDA